MTPTTENNTHPATDPQNRIPCESGSPPDCQWAQQQNPQWAQQGASDPKSSVWVSASAGTGKTKVLTDRLLRLLLEGNAPQRILCLTFTRAAAAEMANRLHERLSRWAILQGDPLDQELKALGFQEPSHALKTQAQTLFTKVLETPGGLKIQTIHGFCQALLKRFPLEAGIPPHFEVLEEVQSKHFLKQAQEEIFKQALQCTQTDAALTIMAQRFEMTYFSQKIQSVVMQRPEQDPLSLGVLDPQEPSKFLTQALSFSQDQERSLKDAAQALLSGKTTDQNRGKGLLTWLAKEKSQRVLFWEDYTRLFLTQRGDPLKTLCTKTWTQTHEHHHTVLVQESHRLAEALETYTQKIHTQTTHALNFLGALVFQHYKRLKTQKGKLDFQDLIETTVGVLRNPGVAPWILYKLDGGLDHILVDEAQDTSPAQWEIITSLAEDFFSSSPEDTRPRTLFVVGDTKQSIYSFQGAEPETFEHLKKHFQGLSHRTQHPWRVVDLNTSFRSTEAILKVVDQVFEDPELKESLLLGETALSHQAFRQGQGGIVEIWPLAICETPLPPQAWDLPIQEQDTCSQGLNQNKVLDPETQVAKIIAGKIDALVKNGVQLPSRGRSIRPCDILVLVRRRGTFVPKLIKTLKALGIPVAGADRMILKDQLVVQDLLALGEFLLLPDDDLTLAAFLKSPLGGFNEETLYALCVERTGSLWQALKESPHHSETVSFLTTLLTLKDHVRPFELYMEVLVRFRGKYKFLERLGTDCLDPLEEFLNVIQRLEILHTPTLQNILFQIQQESLEIKRDFDQSGQGDTVRLMTIHGAKGLQAPVVILPDTTTRLFGSSHASLVSENDDFSTEEKERQEYWRLLYVALTRAEDQLYITGWCKRASGLGEEKNWYSVLNQSLKILGKETTPGVYTYTPHALEEIMPSPPQEAFQSKNKEYPSWMVTPVTLEPTPLWKNPSKVLKNFVSYRGFSGVSAPEVSPSLFSSTYAAHRGTLIHTLLEKVPLFFHQRTTYIERFLEQVDPPLHHTQRHEIATHTLKILESPIFQSFLGPKSFAEVPVFGMLKGTYVSGKIDRLVERDNEILILDYKTHCHPTLVTKETLEQYGQQLRLYRDLLFPLYPHHTFITGLFWTENLELQIVP